MITNGSESVANICIYGHYWDGEKRVKLGVFTTNLLFVYLKLHGKIQNHRTTPSWRKVFGGERKDKKKKSNTKYSGHFVPSQRPRAGHTLRSEQCKFVNM